MKRLENGSKKEKIFTKEVGRKMKAHRGSKPQDIMADMLGMNLSTYSRIENAKYNPTLTYLCLLSDCLKCSIAYLIGDQHFK